MRVLEVETATPSPFAASLLFGYVGAFMYEGDSPLAERRAAALSLDTALLAELLGRVELRELLDPDVVATTSRQLQHLTPDRAARDAEAVADLLRLLGPLTEDEIAERSTATDVGAWLEGLRAARRALPVSFAGRAWWVAIEDIGRLRDGVGVAVPVGVPATFTEAVADPLGELLGRYARTRGPFTTADAAARFGLGLRVAGDVLGRLAADRQADPWRIHRHGNRSRGIRAVVRRRGPAHPAAPVAGRAARTGRTGRHRGLRPVPAGVAAGGRGGNLGRRGPGRRDRPTRRCGHPRLGGGAVGVRPAGAGLHTGHARRVAGLRRGHLVGHGSDRRRIIGFLGRLGGIPSGRHRAADLDAADRPGPDRHASGHPGRTRQRRGLFLPAVGIDNVSAEALKEALWQLIWSGSVDRGHVRTGAGAAVGHPPLRHARPIGTAVPRE